MAGKKLTTIYSVAEGRTLVLASDGCPLCLGAFSLLINSSPEVPSSEEDQDPLKGLRTAKADRHPLSSPPWLHSENPPTTDKHRHGGSHPSPGAADSAIHAPLAHLRLEGGGEEEQGTEPGEGPQEAGAPTANSQGQEEEGRRERGRRGGEEGEERKTKAHSPKEERRKGQSPKGQSPKGQSPKWQGPKGEARKSAPHKSPLAHKDDARRKTGAGPTSAHKEERRGGDHKEGEEKKSPEASQPRPVVVYRPAEEEGAASSEQELSLRTTDRLIVALYTHPSHLGLPAVPHVPVPDGEHRGLGSMVRRTQSKDKESLRSGREAQDDSNDAIPGLPPAHPKQAGPKLGQGDTFILNPAEWGDVEASLELWGCARSRDSLARMAQAARERQIRFEAFKVEELAEEGVEAEEGPSKGPSKPFLPSTKRKSSELGHSLVAFCKQVEASMLLLGVHHSHQAHELKSKSFVHNFCAYCLEHCHCDVRAVSGQQVKDFVGEPSTPNESFKSKHSVIDTIVTNYVRDL